MTEHEIKSIEIGLFPFTARAREAMEILIERHRRILGMHAQDIDAWGGGSIPPPGVSAKVPQPGEQWLIFGASMTYMGPANDLNQTRYTLWVRDGTGALVVIKTDEIYNELFQAAMVRTTHE